MSYTRTPELRAAIAARNQLLKRKYPNGYDTKSRLYRIKEITVRQEVMAAFALKAWPERWK